jgi:hypothetical protein
MNKKTQRHGRKNEKKIDVRNNRKERETGRKEKENYKGRNKQRK